MHSTARHLPVHRGRCCFNRLSIADLRRWRSAAAARLLISSGGARTSGLFATLCRPSSACHLRRAAVDVSRYRRNLNCWARRPTCRWRWRPPAPLDFGWPGRRCRHRPFCGRAGVPHTLSTPPQSIERWLSGSGPLVFQAYALRDPASFFAHSPRPAADYESEMHRSIAGVRTRERIGAISSRCRFAQP